MSVNSITTAALCSFRLRTNMQAKDTTVRIYIRAGLWITTRFVPARGATLQSSTTFINTRRTTTSSSPPSRQWQQSNILTPSLLVSRTYNSRTVSPPLALRRNSWIITTLQRSSSGRNSGASTRSMAQTASCKTSQASILPTGVVAVAEAVEEIAKDAEAENVWAEEESMERTAGCPENSLLRNRRISQRRRKHRSARIWIRWKKGSRTLFHSQGPTS